MFTEQVPGQEQTLTVDFAKIMLAALTSGGVQGLTVGGMRQRLSVIDKLEKAQKAGADHVLLEDAERDVLAEAIEGHHFVGFFRGAIELLDAVKNAPDVEVTEAVNKGN